MDFARRCDASTSGLRPLRPAPRRGRGAGRAGGVDLCQGRARPGPAPPFVGRHPDREAKRVRPWPWADAWPVARIILPDGDHIVLGGASGRNLAFAPGHLDGTSLPGISGTCVIAGHRDTHFAILEDLVKGDPVQLEDASGIVTHYRVAATGGGGRK